MSIYEKEGGGGEQSPVYMCISTCTLGGSGGMLPQKSLDFRLSETACFLVHSRGLCIEWRNFNLEAICSNTIVGYLSPRRGEI